MNDFLKSLTAFGMEGMNAEETVVEAYAGSECAEELIELDNLDNMTAAMESMADAIMENGLGAQTMALEAAGYSLDTASGFTGELSTEAIGNMVKRGYYEVKIQLKKAIQKIWKLLLSVVDNLMGSEGRLKSYGKLFKKYNERLSKVHPKEGKDGEDKEVTIRNWGSVGLEMQVGNLQTMGGEWIKEANTLVKTIDVKAGIEAVGKIVVSAVEKFYKVKAAEGKNPASTTDNSSALNLGKKLSDKISTIQFNQKDFSETNIKAMEDLEKEFEDYIKDNDLKDNLKDTIDEMKDVDSDEVSIYKAKEDLLSIGRKLEELCKKDLKFKKNLMNLKKSWDKKTGDWKLAETDNNNTAEYQRFASAVMRILNKGGVFITGYRLAVSAYYKAVASNLQGVLADMAKVIAKGTNIQK